MVHRIVNLDVRAVHRATDTGGVCGGGGHAGGLGMPAPGTFWSRPLRAKGRRFWPGRTVAGAGERAIQNGVFRVRSGRSAGAKTEVQPRKYGNPKAAVVVTDSH